MKKKKYTYETTFEYITGIGIAIGFQKYTYGTTMFIFLPFLAITIEKKKLKKKVL